MKLDRPGQSCSNGFTRCINQFIYDKVGCSLSPEERKDKGWAKCQTMSQIQELNGILAKLLLTDQEKTLHLTGCKTPCEYKKYSITGPPVDYDIVTNNTEFWISFNFQTRLDNISKLNHNIKGH